MLSFRILASELDQDTSFSCNVNNFSSGDGRVVRFRHCYIVRVAALSALRFPATDVNRALDWVSRADRRVPRDRGKGSGPAPGLARPATQLDRVQGGSIGLNDICGWLSDEQANFV